MEDLASDRNRTHLAVAIYSVGGFMMYEPTTDMQRSSPKQKKKAGLAYK